MDDGLRRVSDHMLADFDKRLALVEQAQNLHAKASEARQEAVQKSIEALAAEIRGILNILQSSTADPKASPAGRQLSEDLEFLKKEVQEHDDFVSEVRGAIKLARFALGTSLLSALGTLVLLYRSIQQTVPGG